MEKKKKKGIALKATSSIHEGSDEDENGDLEGVEVNEQEFNLLMRKFGRFSRRNGIKENLQRRTTITERKLHPSQGAMNVEIRVI